MRKSKLVQVLFIAGHKPETVGEIPDLGQGVFVQTCVMQDAENNYGCFRIHQLYIVFIRKQIGTGKTGNALYGEIHMKFFNNCFIAETA